MSRQASNRCKRVIECAKNCYVEKNVFLCFPDCWKVSSVVPVFKNVGERSDPKNYGPVSLLFVVSKVFQKPINDKLFRHLESVGLFSDFQYACRSSRSMD